MERSYYIEGEIGEIKFEGPDKVLFTLIPSQDYRRRDGDREYALKMHTTAEGLSAVNILMDDFQKNFFVCENKALASQISVLKVNRNIVRVEVTEENPKPTMSVSVMLRS